MPRHVLIVVFLVGLFLSPAQAQEKSDVHDRIRRLPATLLATKKSDSEITDAMFIAILIRLPTADEKSRVTKIFATRGKREHVVEQLMWALVNTKEFAALHGLSDITATPAGQEFVPPVLGPKAFRHGEAIEITGVWATSPRLEPGDSVTVHGRVRLASRDQAQLGLHVTQTADDGKEKVDQSQVVQVKRGQNTFELKAKINHRGTLHLTLYDDLGRPFGGVYFGTAEQMRQIEGWSLDYYLRDPPPDKAQEKKTGKAKPELPDEQRNQIARLEVLQRLVEQGERTPDNLGLLLTTVSARGTLLKTPDLSSRSPRTGLPQSHHWRLAAHTEAGELVLPLQITDKKLLELADAYAGKEVVLTGSTVLLRRLMQRYESPPYLAVKVVALRLPEK